MQSQRDFEIIRADALTFGISRSGGDEHLHAERSTKPLLNWPAGSVDKEALIKAVEKKIVDKGQDLDTLDIDLLDFTLEINLSSLKQNPVITTMLTRVSDAAAWLARDGKKNASADEFIEACRTQRATDRQIRDAAAVAGEPGFIRAIHQRLPLVLSTGRAVQTVPALTKSCKNHFVTTVATDGVDDLLSPDETSEVLEINRKFAALRAMGLERPGIWRTVENGPGHKHVSTVRHHAILPLRHERASTIRDLVRYTDNTNLSYGRFTPVGDDFITEQNSGRPLDHLYRFRSRTGELRGVELSIAARNFAERRSAELGAEYDGNWRTVEDGPSWPLGSDHHDIKRKNTGTRRYVLIAKPGQLFRMTEPGRRLTHAATIAREVRTG